ncbi:allantoicase [Pseudomonadota bacterium]|jgi:allantoicase|nr:allantoicase [Alphaproteobacteria bacterium]MDC1356594.1 allantoicase [Pseudomonadota bacterium]
MTIDSAIKGLVNLASPKMGTKILAFSDDFFGEVTRMLNDKDPIFIEDKYDNHGKWMDGWESKRRRDGGNDWAIIKLGSAGIISKIEIDTSYFTGNFPPFFSLEGIYSETEPDKDSNWTTLIDKTSLIGDCKNNFELNLKETLNFIRLQIFPDGGVARIRLFGEVKYNWKQFNSDEIIELSSLKLGGSILAYNNAHYGDVSALLSDGRGKTMGDGWETRRRREPGNDWIIIKLAQKGNIEKIEIDTAHFKGNYPDRASIQATSIDKNITTKDLIQNSENWNIILNETKLSADNIHKYKINSNSKNEATHIRLNIYPDGGVSRLRIFGTKLDD